MPKYQTIANEIPYKSIRIYERSHETAKMIKEIMKNDGDPLTVIKIIDMALMNELERRSAQAPTFIQTKEQLEAERTLQAQEERFAQQEEERRQAVAQYVS